MYSHQCLHFLSLKTFQMWTILRAFAILFHCGGFYNILPCSKIFFENLPNAFKNTLLMLKHSSDCCLQLAFFYLKNSSKIRWIALKSFQVSFKLFCLPMTWTTLNFWVLRSQWFLSIYSSASVIILIKNHLNPTTSTSVHSSLQLVYWPYRYGA